MGSFCSFQQVLAGEVVGDESGSRGSTARAAAHWPRPPAFSTQCSATRKKNKLGSLSSWLPGERTWLLQTPLWYRPCSRTLATASCSGDCCAAQIGQFLFSFNRYRHVERCGAVRGSRGSTGPAVAHWPQPPAAVSVVQQEDGSFSNHGQLECLWAKFRSRGSASLQPHTDHNLLQPKQTIVQQQTGHFSSGLRVEGRGMRLARSSW
jgi:hypothetical protein